MNQTQISTVSLLDSLKSRAAVWLVVGIFLSLLFSALIAWMNLRTSAENNILLEINAMAKSFRSEILSGQVKSAESKMRLVLALNPGESVKVLDRDLKDAYYDGETHDNWPADLRNLKAIWSGPFKIKAAAPIYFDQDQHSLFGYAVLQRSPQLNWRIIFTVFGSLMLGQFVFAWFYRSSVIRVGSHLSRQLATLSENLDRIDQTELQGEHIAELDKIRKAFHRAHAEINLLTTAGDSTKSLRQVAHDIRSPLTALSMGIQSLKEVPRPTRELLEMAYKRMDLITSNILADKDRRLIPLRDLRRQLDDLVQEKAAEHVQRHLNWGFVFACDEHASIAISMESLLRTVSNLLNNSAEASKSCNLVRLEVHSDNDFLSISVIDEGSGIPLEARELILSGGISTKKDGHGLGLSSANKFALSHHGRLIFHTLEHGFKVEMTLALSKINEQIGSA